MCFAGRGHEVPRPGMTQEGRCLPLEKSARPSPGMEGRRHALLFCKQQPATNCHHDNTSPTSTTCMVQWSGHFASQIQTRCNPLLSLQRLFVPKRLELHVILHSNPPSPTTQPAMRLLPSTTRRQLALLLLLLPALATYGHAALRQTQTQSQSERPIEETPAAPTGIAKAAAAAAAVSAGGEADKLALPLTQSLSEQDPAILGGDPASHFLMNFGHNAMANGVRKHHPKTYEEVAR